MTETRNISEEKLLEKYLYDELTPDEREALEESFFADEQLFAGLLELENTLVDRYASGKMTAQERNRFESKYLTTPEKREKAANAAALRKFITERQAPASAAAVKNETNVSFWERLRAVFAAPNGWQSAAAAALAVLLFFGIGFLIFDGWRLRNEIAGLKNAGNQNANVPNERERELQNEIEKARERERQLEQQLNEKAAQSENFEQEQKRREDDLNRERNERARLERELEKLRERKQAPENDADAVLNPVFAAVLRPNSAENNAGNPPTIAVSKNAKRLNLTLTLPPKAESFDRFSVQLNGRQIAANLKLRVSANGNKRLRLRLRLDDLSETEHRIIVKNQSETFGEVYIFRLRKQ